MYKCIQDLPNLHRNYVSGAIIWGFVHPTKENILLLLLHNYTPVKGHCDYFCKFYLCRCLQEGGASPAYSAVPKSQELGQELHQLGSYCNGLSNNFFLGGWEGGGGVSGATNRKLPKISWIVSAKLINNRYVFIWYKIGTYSATQHGTRNIEMITMSDKIQNNYAKKW